MAERVVTLKLRVDDKDVDKATASVNRLEKAAKNVGGDTQQDRLARFMQSWSKEAPKAASGINQAEAAIQATTQASARLAAGSGEAAAGLAGLGTAGMAVAGTAAVVLAALAAVVAVAVVLGNKVFELSKEFADYALKVGKASETTGLMTETVSALMLQADRTGTPFETLVSRIDNFRKTVGQAIAGSTEAEARLRLLGQTGVVSASNLDTAFRQATATIVRAKDPVDQIKLAYAAFGDEGYKLLPFLRSFGGDFAALEREAEKLGITIGGKDVKAAKEFNAAYTDMQKAIQGLTNLFGREFLPTVTRAIQDFTGWLAANKEDVKAWATWTGDWVQYLVDKFKDLVDAVRNFHKEQRKLPASVANISEGRFGSYAQAQSLDMGRQQLPQPRPLAPAIDANKVYGTPTMVPGADAPGLDPGVLDAARQEAAKRAKEYAEAVQKQAGQLREQLQKLSLEIQYFGDKSRSAAVEQQLIAGGVYAANKAIADQIIWAARHLDSMDAAAKKTKEFEDAQKRLQDALASKKASILSTAANRQFDLEGELAGLQQQIALGRELTGVELQSIANQIEKNKLVFDLQVLGADRKAIEEMLKVLDLRQKDNLQLVKQIDLQKQQIEADKQRKAELERIRQTALGMQEALEDEILILSRGGRELTRYERVLQAIERGTLNWEEANKKNLIVLAQQADALDELNRRHAELKDFFGESLTYVFEGDFGGLLDSFRRRITDSFVDSLSSSLATSFLGFDPNATENPIAKPIVSEIQDTNRLLGQIVAATGQRPAVSGLGGLSSIFSGGGFGGVGPGGTPPFVASGSGGGGGLLGSLLGGFRIPGDRTGSIDKDGNYVVDGRSIFSKITGPGGLFGDKGFGNNTGTYGAIGAVGNLVGSAVGGRFGSALSGAATGLSIGASIGSIIPGIGTAIGAVIGAAGGFLAGLFGFSDPKRKKDKQENIPALQDGFAKAMKELTDILSGVRRLSIDPDEAVSRASAVRAEIAGGFGIQFLSKKYKKQAATMISTNLVQADGIIQQIKDAADIARGAADRSKRILPEFAGGNYFADYFRPNGLIPGSFDGADNILAMISRGEMVLNPAQISRVKALAGGDVFAGAGIPNYPKASSSPKLAMGGIAGAGLSPASAAPQVLMQPNFIIRMEGVTFDERSKAWLESDDGKRTFITVFRDQKGKGRV